MGGSQSTNQVATVDVKATGPPKSLNNNGDVVVIPVDASQQAEAAFLWYVHHVHKPENEVHVVHCQELCPTSPIISEHTFRTDSWQTLMDRAEEQGKSLTEKYQKKLEEHKLAGSVHFEIGKPGEVVVNSADKFQAAHIVMGTRGFGLVRRTILGSVSEYVIHHTKVPVTVVPRETNHWFF